MRAFRPRPRFARRARTHRCAGAGLRSHDRWRGRSQKPRRARGRAGDARRRVDRPRRPRGPEHDRAESNRPRIPDRRSLDVSRRSPAVDVRGSGAAPAVRRPGDGSSVVAPSRSVGGCRRPPSRARWRRTHDAQHSRVVPSRGRWTSRGRHGRRPRRAILRRQGSRSSPVESWCQPIGRTPFRSWW